MRRLLKLAPLLLAPLLLAVAGCGADMPLAAGAFAIAEVASIPVFGRDIGDLIYSGVTGRNCSVVRLDQGLSWCKPQEPPPLEPTYCTRSLGTVDCWINPETLIPLPSRGVADGPATLTPAQEVNRTARWPNH